MKRSLQAYFIFVFIAMLLVTVWASSIESVIIGATKVIAEPWGIATLADCYFAFLAFFLWLLYKEKGWISRGLWLIAILLLGNFAIAGYVLWQMKSLGPNFAMKELLLRREDL